MTLKEEIELLRNEPIQFIAPVDQIPCNETSDPERLCKHPVVSVHMLTYNHEKFIAQAIEGVIMQETDFEYELIIGEDASQDKTREICLEYQKKHPDKIRVLWSEENVTKPYGGNGARVTARCRGEFIAFCEGDDYWTDPKKLQKQVDVLHKHNECSFCFANAQIYQQLLDNFIPWDGASSYSPGAIPQKELFEDYLYSRKPWIMTASVMVRTDAMIRYTNKEEISQWRFRLGDKTLWLGLARLGYVYYLPDIVSVYRRGLGVTSIPNTRLGVDAACVGYYYAKKYNYDLAPLLYIIFWERYRRIVWMSRQQASQEVKALKQVKVFAPYMANRRFALFAFLLTRFPLFRSLTQMLLRLRRAMNK